MTELHNTYHISTYHVDYINEAHPRWKPNFTNPLLFFVNTCSLSHIFLCIITGPASKEKLFVTNISSILLGILPLFIKIMNWNLKKKKCTITGFNSSVCWLSDYQRIADYVNITVNKSEYFQSYFSATDDASYHNDNFLFFSKALYYLSTYI